MVVFVLCAYESQRHFALQKGKLKERRGWGHEGRLGLASAGRVVRFAWIILATAAFVLMQQFPPPPLSTASLPLHEPLPARSDPISSKPLGNLHTAAAGDGEKMKMKMENKFEKLKKQASKNVTKLNEIKCRCTCVCMPKSVCVCLFILFLRYYFRTFAYTDGHKKRRASICMTNWKLFAAQKKLEQQKYTI